MSAGHTPWQAKVQPESLRIAKALDDDQWRLDDLDIEAAGELRRLHAMNTELLDAMLMVKGAALTQRGLDFNLTAEQWLVFHAAIAKATGAPSCP